MSAALLPSQMNADYILCSFELKQSSLKYDCSPFMNIGCKTMSSEYVVNLRVTDKKHMITLQ
jgi:hypothetical protein